MAYASRVLAAVAMAGVCLASAQSGAVSTRPWQILGKAMLNQRKITCKCLIVCRDMMHPDAMMDVWSEQCSDGQLKMTVLSPLSEQGTTSVDNGHQWITYQPDGNRVYVESSPRQEDTDRTEANRLRLAERNYELSVDSEDTAIAGRKCYTIEAAPRHPEMPDRLYGIDRQKNYLMRMEVVSHGESKVILDTKEIEFPHEISPDDFELSPHGDARVISLSAPSTVSGRDAKRLVGFNPAVPAWLPFGFVVEAPQVADGTDGKFLAVRITDGLVTATVYEFRHKKNKNGAMAHEAGSRDANGIHLRVQGVLPEDVQSDLLDCFVREALKKVESCLIKDRSLETLELGKTLNSAEEPNHESGQEPVGCYSKVFAIFLIDLDE